MSQQHLPPQSILSDVIIRGIHNGSLDKMSQDLYPGHFFFFNIIHRLKFLLKYDAQNSIWNFKSSPALQALACSHVGTILMKIEAKPEFNVLPA